ncbi:unnamed protein product [Discosporangium mesarthrocarpum]
MVALVNTTSINGQEAKMVEDGVVLAMMMIMSEQEDFGRLCATGLFNLTCVPEPYNHIERVLKALVGIAGAPSQEVKHICASAFCNLTDLPVMHARLIEEGIVSTIGSIARGALMKTRRVCAIALHSLAASKQERTNLVSKGCVPVLYGLSSDEDVTTLHFVACTLVRLGMEEQSHARMIQEGAASALCNTAMACASIPSTSLPCALILNTLSQHNEYKLAIAEEGCIPAVVTLLRCSEDIPTQYHALMTFCSILSREENHGPILQQGGLYCVISLTTHPNRSIREACVLVLFNFSCGTAVKERIVQAGAVPAIISLSAGEEVHVASQRCCAATLCNLACAPSNIARMVEEGVIPNIIDLLKTGDIQCVKYCCAALCLVAQDVSNCVLIINEGAIPHMLAGAKEGDIVTKQSCCAVLSTLSSKEDCREQLCNYGALPALIQLASMDDEATKLRCVTAFANLSCEYTIQGEMVKAGVVHVLSELSNSYKEENQLYCARALCNLACHHGCEASLVEEGGVSALMMIAMVRSVSLETKQICAKALLNLVAEDTLPRLLEEGLMAAATNLSKLDDEDSMRACATVLAMLSADSGGRAKFVERKSSLVALFDLLRSTDQGTKVICGKAVCNLVSCADSQLSAVAAGAIPCLRQLAKLGVPEIEASIAQTFFLVSGNDVCREEVTRTALPTIVYLSRSPNSDARWACARTLSTLAWHGDSRKALSGVGVARALVSITEDYSQTKNLEAARLEICTRALFYLATDKGSADRMVEAGTIRALGKVMEVNKSSSGLILAAAALRCLTDISPVEAADSKNDEVVGERTIRISKRGLSDTIEPGNVGPIVTEPPPRDLVGLMIEQGSGALVSKIVEAASPSDDEAALYDCSVVVYNLARTSATMQRDLVGAGVLSALYKLANVRSAQDLVMATLALLSNDSNNREAIIAQGGADLILRLVGGPDDWARQNPMVITNALCALFLLSKASPASREQLKDGSIVMQLLANLGKRGTEPQKKVVASDALSILSRDAGMGIEEGTVSALISRSLDGPGDLDVDDDVIGTSFAVPETAPFSIESHSPGDDLSVDAAMSTFEVQTVTFVKRASGGVGHLPPPPEPPAIEGQALVVAAPPHDMKDVSGEEEDEAPKAMQFAKMEVPKEYMTVNDEELVRKMDKRKSAHGRLSKDPTHGDKGEGEAESKKKVGINGGLVDTSRGKGGRDSGSSEVTDGDKSGGKGRLSALQKSMSASCLNQAQKGGSKRVLRGAPTEKSKAAGGGFDSRGMGESCGRQKAQLRRAHSRDDVEARNGPPISLDQQAAALGLYS